MILVLIPQSTGIAIHEWLSFIILIPFFLHLIINWNWITKHSKNLFKKKLHKTKFDYVFNWILYIVMLLVTVSGIVISEAALPAIGIHFSINPFWTMLHNASATLFIALLGIHLALHWNWIVKTLQKLKFVSEFHNIKQISNILRNRKTEFLILIALSIILSLGIWLIEFTDWAETITRNSTKNITASGPKKAGIQWLMYILPLVKVTVFLCIPAVLTRVIIYLKVKLKN
ncbi:conserved hypothetical membrane protein (DUF4405) [Formosa agariphila KMM 3901]|uniref:Conserved hypothetical membrane protein (DUF4405) n=1 Tax=Formosa agariphila (strain DSM 15362 / KCTC 12365 / LMG 23005 / KMM 3901 / M-2Alg 35-1) TaxID=1347342 RepID=T2KM32_FORAG|nr:DUF4405 domain-containing protein [Formosa agariphila]CDF79491.1 conserved hypothetical membrane protein (DUF4405) [Formosa agariphila KMM 3901]